MKHTITNTLSNETLPQEAQTARMHFPHCADEQRTLVEDAFKQLRQQIFLNPIAKTIRDGAVQYVQQRVDFECTRQGIVHETEIKKLIALSSTIVKAESAAATSLLGKTYLGLLTEFQNELITIEDKFRLTVERYEQLMSRTTNPIQKKFQKQEFSRKIKSFYDILEHLSERFSACLEERIESCLNS